MYDAIRPLIPNIPKDAPIVAGYIDGIEPWQPSDFALFPNAVHVGIAVSASTNNGHVLDVENGDATPDQVPGWVDLRTKSGLQRATIYCSESNWQPIITAVGKRTVDYWLANPTGQIHILPNTVGTQWLWKKDASGNSLYDQSEMLSSWWVLQKTPPLPPNPLPIYVGDKVLHTINIRTDANGNGWAETTIPWNNFQAVSMEGPFPPDNGYWGGNAKVQERDGNVLVSVVGFIADATVQVFVLASA